MPETRQPSANDPESQIWASITVFEQILENIPDDRLALEALALAYEQIGDLSRSCEFLARLAEVVLREGDRAAVESTLQRLQRYRDLNPVIGERAQTLEQFLARTGTTGAAAGATLQSEVEELGAVADDEMSFAWHLKEAGRLTDGEYAAVVEDLSELSASEAAVTLSVLHVLRDQVSPKFEATLEYAATTSGSAFVPVSAFDPSPAVAGLLPMDFIIRQGVLIFEQIGQELLVAVLNPFRKAFFLELERRLGRKCHFYLTDPLEFDNALHALQAKKTSDAADAAATR